MTRVVLGSLGPTPPGQEAPPFLRLLLQSGPRDISSPLHGTGGGCTFQGHHIQPSRRMSTYLSRPCAIHRYRAHEEDGADPAPAAHRVRRDH
jgi:hypothetical protein